MKKRILVMISLLFSAIFILFCTISESNVTYAASTTIVNPKQVYSHQKTTNDIKKLAERYPELIKFKSIGKSTYGRELWAVGLGNGDATVFLNSSHHAREWITTNLVMNMIDQYAQSYTKNQSFEGYNVKDLLNKTTIWFVPMVNPDGVTLQQQGLSAFPYSVHSQLIKANGGSRDFGRWKADALGIDLNRQYPSYWDSISNNKILPSYANHKGTRPLQTPETQAIVSFTYEINPEITVTYHSTGKILYWFFNTKQSNISRDKGMANKFANITGYSLVPSSLSKSGGGNKDWFITELGRPGFTPEICGYIPESKYAGGFNPIATCYDSAWAENKSIGLFIGEEGYNLWSVKTEQINEKLTLTEETPFFHQPLTQSKKVSTITAQTVTAFQKQGNWYRIQTWLGPKWIKPNNPIIGDIEKVDISLTLTEKTVLYDGPSSNAKQVSAIGAQKITAFEKQGDWYHIQTWLGPKWIKPNNPIIGDIEKVDISLTLTEKTVLYDGPSSNAKQVSAIGAQKITAFEKQGDWYHIQTWLGPKWIKPNNPIIGEVEKVDISLTLTGKTVLYAGPFMNAKQVSAIGPQTVTAFEKQGDFYQIQTWLGPLWIKP